VKLRLLDRVTDPNIRRIYAASFALGFAYGIVIALIALFLDGRGFGKQAIGGLAAWFASGIVAFSLPAGLLVRRLSAKRTLLLSLAGYAVAVGIFPFLNSYSALALARFADGACSVGVWVSCESILLARARKDQKAFVMSLYAISMAFGYIAGPLGARALAAVAPLSAAFWCASAVAIAAGVFVFIALDTDARASAEVEHSTHLPASAAASSGLLRILAKTKTACFATFSFGYFQSSVVLFLPLLLIESKGITREQTIVVPAFFAGGMLLFSNIAGRIGDQFGHLLTMRALAVIGASMIASFVFLSSFAMMCGAVFIAGASLASISPVSLALQGVVTEGHEIPRATGLYNAFYAAGMLLGPPISSRIFASHGGADMLYQLALLWMAFVLFSLVFFRDDPASSRSKPWHLSATFMRRRASEE
jgi:MFS family permease